MNRGVVLVQGGHVVHPGYNYLVSAGVVVGDEARLDGVVAASVPPLDNVVLAKWVDERDNRVVNR